MSRFVTAMLALLAASACMQPHPDSTEPIEQPAALSRVQIGGVRWYVDYDAAVVIARDRDRPLWVHFGEHPG